MLKVIQKKHKRTGGHCGTYLKDFKGDIKEVKKILNELYKTNKISIHDGIHGKLVKIKKYVIDQEPERSSFSLHREEKTEN